MKEQTIHPRFGYRRLFSNAVANTATMAVSLVVALFLAPIVLQALGDTNYGAWSFTESFIAYLTLFDFGIAAAIVRFTPRCLIRDDVDELNRVYSASLVFFLGAMMLAIALGGTFDYFLLDQFLPTAELNSDFRWLFRLLVFNFAASLPLSIFPAMLDGMGRFGFKSLIRIGTIALRVPLTLWVIRVEHRLLGLGLVITGCTLLENAILAAGAHWHVRGLRFRPASVTRMTIRHIASYSRDAFVAMLAGRLSFHTDAMVIAPILGPSAVTFFSIPARLVEMGKSLLRSATMTLTGVFSALEANEERDEIRTTFLASARAAWYAALPLAAGLLTLGHPFLTIWVGPKYAAQCWPVLVALALPFALSIAQSVAARVLYGTGQLKHFARATMLDGLANLVISLALIGRLGIAGVAIATAIPHAIFCIWVIGYVCHLLHVSAMDYFRVTAKPLGATIGPVLFWIAAGRVGIDGWLRFFTCGAIGVMAYALVATALEVVPALRRVKVLRGRLIQDLTDLRGAG